jgi:hypothetical protein
MTTETGKRSKESEIEELGSQARIRVSRACERMTQNATALAAVVAQYRLYNDNVERDQNGGK